MLTAHRRFGCITAPNCEQGADWTNYNRSSCSRWLRTLMKDARGGTHSLAESAMPLPARHGLIGLIGHSAAQVQPLLINAVASRGGGNGSGQGGSIVCCETERWHARAAFIGAPHAGSLNDSPLVSTAQAMRAFFAAMATTAFQ